jgi:hypothetical protein
MTSQPQNLSTIEARGLSPQQRNSTNVADIQQTLTVPISSTIYLDRRSRPPILPCCYHSPAAWSCLSGDSNIWRKTSEKELGSCLQRGMTLANTMRLEALSCPASPSDSRSRLTTLKRQDLPRGRRTIFTPVSYPNALQSHAPGSSDPRPEPVSRCTNSYVQDLRFIDFIWVGERGLGLGPIYSGQPAIPFSVLLQNLCILGPLANGGAAMW